MGVGMATTNLFGHPAFKDGAFTSNDRGVRRAAIGKAMRFIDTAAELDAEVYVFWGGREGTEVGCGEGSAGRAGALSRGDRRARRLRRSTTATTCASRWSPSPTSRAGTSSCRRSGTRCTSSRRSSIPEMVGVNPEVAHETMAGLSFHHAIGHALWAEKLFHIDLNSPADRPLRPGLPLRRGGPQGVVPARAPARARGLQRAAALRRALLPQRERRGRVGLRGRAAWRPTARWPRRPRTSTRCPRSRRRSRPPRRPSSASPQRRRRRRRHAQGRGAANLDALAERGYYNERLDQIVVDVLLGTR